MYESLFQSVNYTNDMHTPESRAHNKIIEGDWAGGNVLYFLLRFSIWITMATFWSDMDVNFNAIHTQTNKYTECNKRIIICVAD